MLVTPAEARKVGVEMTAEDNKPLALSFIAHTNNHFHLNGYAPIITKIIGERIYFEGPNLFKHGDLVEAVDVLYYNGFHMVKDTGDDYIDIDFSVGAALPGDKGRLYLVKFPDDVKAGAKEILKYKVKTEDKTGIRSESISRWSTTYEKPNDNSIGGLPGYLYDFLEPYVKMRWG